MQTQTTARGCATIPRPRRPAGRTVPAGRAEHTDHTDHIDHAAPAEPAGVTIRPAAAADAPELRRFLVDLSAETVYSRFFTGIGMVHNRLLAWLLPSGDERDVRVAVHRGRIVGHGMCAPVPDRDGVAEVAVVVADAWQRRGLGPRLVSELLGAAQARGVRSIGFSVLLDNRPANRLATRSWPQARPVVDHGVYEYLVPLADRDAA